MAVSPYFQQFVSCIILVSVDGRVNQSKPEHRQQIKKTFRKTLTSLMK